MSRADDPFLMAGDEPPAGEKLQKVLAAAGVASRRHAEVLIKQGRVTVDGVVATLGQRVEDGARIAVNGIEVGPQAPRLYLLNKPTGVVTTLDDPHGRQTVAHLVPDDVRVYPVGRLDADTSGLLLMTNDGELAHRLMHPSFGVEKTYRALVRGRVAAAVAKQLADGVELEDGPTHPAKVRIVDAAAERSVLELVIHEGRNRQVRRMCDAVGHPVIELARIKYGPLTLGSVAPGTWRSLTEQETRRLRKVAGLAPPRSERADGSTRRQRRAAKFGSPAEHAVEVDGERNAAERGQSDEQQQAKRRPETPGTSAGARAERGRRQRSGGGKGRGGGSGSGEPRRR